MKNSCDTAGNRTRDLSACSAVPEPTATACPLKTSNIIIFEVYQIPTTFCYKNNENYFIHLSFFDVFNKLQRSFGVE
jgi:hypothetical protein